MADEAAASTVGSGSEDAATKKKQRKSYTREYKLEVVKFKERNNLYQTCKHYNLNTKTVLRWVKDKEKIKKGKKGSKHVQHQRKPDFPDMEEELVKEYRELRKKGWSVYS